MSDLEDLLSDVVGDFPIGVRKVVNAAVEHGWKLNAPGVTMALRLNHPTDEAAMPVYITWVVGRTPKGALSFKHFSCGTKGLHKLSASDLLEYLADPTVVYQLPDDAEADGEDFEESPPWSDKATPEENVSAQLGATFVRHEKRTAADIMQDQKERLTSAAPTGLRVAAPPLRVAAPGKQ